jgi:SAM-dependent methyltransferase
MGKLARIVTSLHERTNRDCIARMNDQKVKCMQIAKEYGKEYWDGDRRYGYGGYQFIPGYWEPVARKLIDLYNLTNKSSILDVGCGKGFLLYEMKKLMPSLTIAGFDKSRHGLKESLPEVAEHIFEHDARHPYPFSDKEFDLVISLGCLHNLRIYDLFSSLNEVERVGMSAYVMVEGYRNDEELFNLQCWALTAEAFFSEEEWVWIFNHVGYTGDYEFIYF